MPNKKISQLSQISPVPTGGLMILANSGVSRSATIKEIAEAIQGSSSNTFSGLNDTPSGISGNMFAVGSPDGSDIVFSKDLHLGTGHFLDKRYGGTISGTVTMATGEKIKFANNSNFINSAGENLAIFSSSHIKMRSASGTNIYQVGGEEAKVNFYTGYSDEDKIHVIHTLSGKYISSGLNHYLNSDTDISGRIFQSGKEILTGLYQLKSDQRNFTDLADVPSNSLSSVPSHIIRVSEIGDSLEYYDTGHFVGADETGILVGRNETGQFMGTGLSGLFAEASKTGIFVVGSGVPENISAKWTKSYLSSVASSRWTQHPGGAWVANNNYTNLAQTSTTGGGSGALFNVGVDNNGTPTFTWVSGGGGYAAGDTLTFADPNNSSATVVLSVDSLEALDINVLTSGITIDDGDDFYPNETRSVSLGKSTRRWKNIQTQRLEAWATGSNADGDDSWIKAKSMYTGNAYAEFIATNTESDGVMRLGISSTGVDSRNIGSGNYYLYGEGGSGSSFIIGNKHDLLFFANTGIENSHAESIAGGQNPPALKIHTSGLVTFSEAFTMPTGDGAASTFLQTDGAGTVSWGNASQNFTELSDTPSNYISSSVASSGWTQNPGGAWVANNNYTNLAQTSTTGGGSGALFNVGVDNNGTPTFTWVSGGGGYAVGDTLTFADPNNASATVVLTVNSLGIAAGHIIKVNAAGNALEYFDSGVFVGENETGNLVDRDMTGILARLFSDLDDTPSRNVNGLLGSAGESVVIAVGGNSLTFSGVAGGGGGGGGSSTFVGLSDTEPTMGPHLGKVVYVKDVAGVNTLGFLDTGHFVGADEISSFITQLSFSQLSDVTLGANDADKFVSINNGFDGLTFRDIDFTDLGDTPTNYSISSSVASSGWTQNPGGAWVANNNYTNLAQTSTSGGGSGALFNVGVDNSGTPTFTWVSGGGGYAVGDTITFADPGNASATVVLTVNSLSASNNFVTVNADGDGLSFFPSGSVTFASETGDFVDIYMTGNLVDVDMTGNLVDIDMTGNLVDVDMTGNLVDIDMTGILVGKNESGQFVGDHETGVFLTEQSLSGTYSTQFEIQALVSAVASAGWTVEPGGGTWAGDQNYSNLAQTSTSGGGSGALFNVSVDNSGTPTFTWVSGGTGYVVGDTITFADPGNGPSATDIVLTINSLNGGTIYFLSEITAGSHTTTSMVPKPVINLNRGNTYKFKSTASALNHGFYIATQAGGGPNAPHEYTSGVTNSQFGGAGKNIYFRVPQNAPEKLYYECNSHTNMGNTITVWDDTGDFVLKSETGDFVDIYMTGNKLVGIEATGDFYSRRGGPISGDVSILGNSGLYVSGDLKVQSGISYNPSYYTGDGTVIDWASGNLLYKNLPSSINTYNFTNVTEGQTLTMYVHNTSQNDLTPQFTSGVEVDDGAGGTRTENAVRWPADIDGNNNPPKVFARTTNVYTFININTGIFTSYLTGYDYRT